MQVHLTTRSRQRTRCIGDEMDIRRKLERSKDQLKEESRFNLQKKVPKMVENNMDVESIACTV